MVASDAAATETLESSRRRVWAAVLPQSLRRLRSRSHCLLSQHWQGSPQRPEETVQGLLEVTTERGNGF